MAVLHFSSLEELNYQLSPSKWSKRMGAKAVRDNHFKLTEEATLLARKSVKCSLDVPYSSRGNKLDIYYPENGTTQNTPVLIHFHGGYWQKLSKDNSGGLAIPLTSSGVVLVGVDYPLCPEVTVTELMEEVRNSVLFVRKQFPNSCLYLSGHSCGGQISGYLMCADWNKLGLENPKISGAILFDGYYDFNVFQYCVDNEPVKVTQKEIDEFTPIRIVSSLSVPGGAKCLVYSSVHTPDEYKRQGKEFMEALISRGVECVYRVVPDTDHFNLVDDLPDPDYSVTKDVIDFITSHSATKS